MTADELFEQAASNWRDNKGVGTALVPAPLNDKVLVYNILTKIYAKSPNTTTIIIVDSLYDRTNILEFLKNQNNEENDKEFAFLIQTRRLRVLTKSFIANNNTFVKLNAILGILYRPCDCDIAVKHFIDGCKYKLVIVNSLSSDKSLNNLFKDIPILPCFKQAEITELRTSSPIEEMWVDVTIPEDSENWKLYQYYCSYIETSINIFGSFEILQQARIGNSKLNISAATICEQIAQENGWNEHLDMSYSFNKQIDELYNPNALRERASHVYEVIKNRNNLVSDYKGKLEEILKIVKENEGHKILIISKRGEFANEVTNYLNENFEADVCGNYHNKVPDIPAVDINGNPVYFKTGKEKGKRKSMSYRAQMTLNEIKFNENLIYCLSMSNAPDKSLEVNFDIIIITSPLCEDIKSYLYRLSNISLIADKIKLFSIFCKDTIEQRKLINKVTKENHLIVNKDKILLDDKNNFDFTLVD